MLKTYQKQNRRTLWVVLFVVWVVLMGFIACGSARADEIAILADNLTANAAIPLAPGVAEDLATVMWDAHEATPYALSESDSMSLSLTAVLRAIALSAPATEIVDELDTPLPWLQAELPIDDQASVTITPSSVDFGDIAIATPEPSSLVLCLIGFVAVLRRIR